MPSASCFLSDPDHVISTRIRSSGSYMVFILDVYTEIAVPVKTNICYLFIVNNKLQWPGSRLRSNFALYNPVFQLHCFIIQRKSLFCTLPYFAFEHQ